MRYLYEHHYQVRYLLFINHIILLNLMKLAVIFHLICIIIEFEGILKDLIILHFVCM
jgi:hypothetical protein